MTSADSLGLPVTSRRGSGEISVPCSPAFSAASPSMPGGGVLSDEAPGERIGIEISFELDEALAGESDLDTSSSVQASADCGVERSVGDLEGDIAMGDICILPPTPFLSRTSTEVPSSAHKLPLYGSPRIPLPPTPPTFDESEFVFSQTPLSLFEPRSPSVSDRSFPLVLLSDSNQHRSHTARHHSAPEPRIMTSLDLPYTRRRPSDLDAVQRHAVPSPAMAPLHSPSASDMSANNSTTAPKRRTTHLGWSGLKRTLSLGSPTSTTGINSRSSSVSGTDATTSRPTSIDADAASGVITDATLDAQHHRRSSSLSLGQSLRRRLSSGADGATRGDAKDAAGAGVGRTSSGRERAEHLRITVPRASAFRTDQHQHLQHRHQHLRHGGTRDEFIDGPSDCTDDNQDEFLAMRGPGSIAGPGGSTPSPSASSLMAPLSSGLPPLLDDHIRAPGFPTPPPGRVVSVTSLDDMLGGLMGPGLVAELDLTNVLSNATRDPLLTDLPVVEAMRVMRDRQGTATEGSSFNAEREASVSDAVATASSTSVPPSTALDCFPTIPAVKFELKDDIFALDASPRFPRAVADKDITTSSSRTDTYCPPSPSLTPSPNLSLRADSLVLTTPDSVNQRDAERTRCYGALSDEKPLRLPSLGPLAAGVDADDPRPTVTTVSTTTARPVSPSSSSCTVTTIGDLLHTYTRDRTSLPRVDTAERTMSVIWSRDADPTPSNARPFHHKQTPSGPNSTRTSYASSTNHPDPSTYSSPPTVYTQLSRRHSKYTAFSGSSASSITSSDSASLRHGTPHWGLGEKPDISTVFEEDDEFDALGRSVKGDATADEKSPSELDRFHQPGQRQPSRADAGRPKDLELAQSRLEHVHQHHHHQLSSSTSLSNLSDRPPSRGNHFSHSTLPRGTATRTQRSGTISSEVSSRSERTTKSAHPFATMARTASPPMLPFRDDYKASGMTSSRSMPNMPAYDSPGAGSGFILPEVVIAEPDVVDDDVCPVCNVSLSSEYRVRGEKPLVIAECGHEVHYDCFVLCYGENPRPNSNRSYGMCGICRQPMKVVDGGARRKGKKSNKLAMLTGEAGEDDPFDLYSRPQASSASITSSRQQASKSENDPIDIVGLGNGGVQPKDHTMTIAEANNGRTEVTVPIITVRTEFASVSKVKQPNKGSFMTAMISVIVPPAGDRGKYKPASRTLTSSTSASSGFLPQLPPSPLSDEFAHGSMRQRDAISVTTVMLDLERRMIDYNSSGLDAVGPLMLGDILAVRKNTMMRDFNVYLFEEALICVTQEKKSGLMSSMSRWKSHRSESASSSSGNTIVPDSKLTSPPALKLKGRIYLRHVKQIVDTSNPGDLSLTIVMIDPRMDSFILVFKEPKQHSKWRNTLNDIVQSKAAAMSGIAPQPKTAKLGKMFGQDFEAVDAARKPETANQSANLMLAATPSSAGFSSMMSPSAGSVRSGLGDFAFDRPLGPMHTPLDLVVVLSMRDYKVNKAAPERLDLRLKVMRQSLMFILATLGPRDRVSFVSAQTTNPPVVRKTPLLNPTKATSRARLENFIDTMGLGRLEDDENEVEISSEDRGDVVCAMNSALDVILSRGTRKNPLGSIVAISDNPENIKRAQMDLVTARLDTANVPVNTVGYGRDHDPSPLWMISNHTHGTYTFIGPEWYGLRKVVAGILGGLMSVAITNMRLFLDAVPHSYKVLRVAGASNSVVQQEGKVVEVELRELRFGETREVLVELDLTDPPSGPPSVGAHNRHSGSSGSDGTPNRSAPSDGGSLPGSSSYGHDRYSSNASALAEVMMRDNSISDEGVFDLNCSFHDPAVGRSVMKLVTPIVLTVAVQPPNAAIRENHPDPSVVRRRMEILMSEMITRALLIASRKNYSQAMTVLIQTRTIIANMGDRIRSSLVPTPGSDMSESVRLRREASAAHALGCLRCLNEDLERMIEGLDGDPAMFERDQRNFAAQQAVVVRSQRAWTVDSPSERVYCTEETKKCVEALMKWVPNITRWA